MIANDEAGWQKRIDYHFRTHTQKMADAYGLTSATLFFNPAITKARLCLYEIVSVVLELAQSNMAVFELNPMAHVLPFYLESAG